MDASLCWRKDGIGPLNHGFWGPRVKMSQCCLDNPFPPQHFHTQCFAFKACCASGYTVALLIGYVYGLFLIPFVLFVFWKHRASNSSWEGEAWGNSSALSVTVLFVLLFDSLPSGFWSLPQPAIHRLHRPNLLDLFWFAANVNTTFSLTGISNN